jgi:hypothetical protein
MRNRFHTPRIVQPGSGHSLWLWLLALVVAGVLSWKMFEFGLERAGYQTEARDTEVALLEQRIESLQRERDELRAAAARYERASQIDQSAVSKVREDLAALQEERSELRQEVEFLKSLVSGSVSLLQITDMSLSKQDSGDGYRVAFTLSKRAKGKKRVSGKVLLSVAGQLEGEPTVLKGKELGLETDSQKMGFMHFQQVEAELKLPVGFIPKEVRIEVQPKGKEFKAFDESFEWQVS